MTRLGQPSARKQATTEDDPATDGDLEHTPEDEAGSQDNTGDVAGDGAGDRGRADDASTDEAGARDRTGDASTDQADARDRTGDAPTDQAGGRDDEMAGDPAGRLRGPRRVATWVTTGLACLVVLFALIAPNDLNRFSLSAFLRIPVEGLVGVVLLLVLRASARRVVAVLAGVALGLLTVLKLLDMGFLKFVARPFDVVLDWVLLGPAWEFVRDAYGLGGAIGAVVLLVAVAAAMLILMPLSVLSLTRIAVRHRSTTMRTVAVLAVIVLVDILAGRPITPKVPLAKLAYARAQQVRAGLHDQEAFAAEAAVDAFRDTPGEKLLTGLRRKDVVLAFVESYGRDAVEDPEIAPPVRAVLDAEDRRLRAAGFASRSAFLTSPTFGGSSWQAQSTFLSGLWINNQPRYRNLVSSDRLTLPSAFRRANWRTVAVAPGIRRAWPEALFFGYERTYASWDLQYRGPRFSWALMPDQFTLAGFERLEHARKDRGPLMATIPLVSSHTPWTPIPKFLPWKDLGDGSVFTPIAAAGPSPKVWRSTAQLRADYGRSIEYSLSSLLSYIETYGDDDLVVVFLGDHQPNPTVTGPRAKWDVPITIVAHDQAVLDQISGWGWHDGLTPGPQAPVWRMDQFRDRFLTAFGSQPRPVPSPNSTTGR
ncbi:hypothetical protein GCM10022226_56270 [Sphaerisporangium flaviroseum]|uniref:Sulfatase n=1 Tax=Sphaerisporangium flaviroseum TaxID=509199 RepID=A0ABP7IVM4_9ACTN